MVERININRLPCFEEKTPVERLNQHLQKNRELMPHEVAGVTGCKLEEAMQLLMLLFHLEAAELLLLVYHNDHLTTPAEARPIADGYPPLPFKCSLCEEDISDEDELSYDFLFILNRDIVLEANHGTK